MDGCKHHREACVCPVASSDAAVFLRSDSDCSRQSSGGVVAMEAGGGAPVPGILHDLQPQQHGSVAVAGRLHAAAAAAAALDGNASTFFQPSWRDVSGSAVPGRSTGSEQAREAASARVPVNETLMKEFCAILEEYFDVDGRKSRVELRVNTTTPCTRRGPPSSSSDFRGVTRHRRTKKWESHIWYNKKQLYLGGFKAAMDAAKAHDIMGLKLKKTLAHTNFEPQGYSRLMRYLDELSTESVMEALRMCSKGNGTNRIGTKARMTFRAPRTAPVRRYKEQASDSIRATLLPRTWGGDTRAACTGVRLPNTVRNDHHLVQNGINDYLPLPGHLSASCEVIEGSHEGIFCKGDGQSPCNPFGSVTNQHSEMFAMDMQGNGCSGRHPYESDGDHSRLGSHGDNKSQIYVTIPQTRSEQYMMPVTAAPSRKVDGVPTHMDSNVHDLLGVKMTEQSSVSIANSTTLVQTPDAVIVKVPVIPSKVIRFPQGSPDIPIFASHLEQSMPTSAPIASPHHIPEESLMHCMQVVPEDASVQAATQLSQVRLDSDHHKNFPIHLEGDKLGILGVPSTKARTASSDTVESTALQEVGFS